MAPVGLKEELQGRTTARLRALHREGAITDEVFVRGIAIATEPPTTAEWRAFAARLLTLLGVAFCVSGVFFFFAYNWADLGRFGKFGLLEAAIALAVLAAWRLPTRLGRDAALLIAALLVGPLLAVYGQTYQTGADPYELFVGWLLLISLWVATGRSPVLWLVALVLANVSLLLYWETVVERHESWTPVGCYAFLLNAAAWSTWETLARRGVAPAGRWWPRTVATAACYALTGASILVIVDDFEANLLGPVILTPALYFALLYWYRRRAPDLYMLAIGVASAIAIVTTLAGRILFEGVEANAGTVLFLGALLIGELAMAAWWLREVRSEMARASQ